MNLLHINPTFLESDLSYMSHFHLSRSQRKLLHLIHKETHVWGVSGKCTSFPLSSPPTPNKHLSCWCVWVCSNVKLSMFLPGQLQTEECIIETRGAWMVLSGTWNVWVCVWDVCFTNVCCHHDMTFGESHTSLVSIPFLWLFFKSLLCDSRSSIDFAFF